MPKFYEAFYRQGFALGHLGRHEQALGARNQSLRLNPDSASAQNRWRVVTKKLEKS